MVDGVHGRVQYNVRGLLLAAILLCALVCGYLWMDLLAFAERLRHDKVKTEKDRDEERDCASHFDQILELMQEKERMMRSLPSMWKAGKPF